MYVYKKVGGMHLVLTATGGKVQFRTARKALALQWILDNSPESEQAQD